MDKPAQIFFLKKPFLPFSERLYIMAMSLNHKYSQQTVVKALHWLDKQPDNWINHITDSNIAVKMYLKSRQKRIKNPSAFEKELNTLLQPEKTSPCLLKKSYYGQQNNFDKEDLKWSVCDIKKTAPATSPKSNTPDEEKIFGARLAKKATHPPLSPLLQKSSPPSQHTEEQLPSQKTNPWPEKEKQLPSQQADSPPEKEGGFFCLDTVSQQAVEQTKKELNMERPEEALRALIQLGRRLLKKLY